MTEPALSEAASSLTVAEPNAVHDERDVNSTSVNKVDSSTAQVVSEVTAANGPPLPSSNKHTTHLNGVHASQAPTPPPPPSSSPQLQQVQNRSKTTARSSNANSATQSTEVESDNPPQIKASPSNSHHANDALIDSTIYGTRSRNRTGNARPNYAEDQEMDFEYTAAVATSSSKKKSTNELTNGVTSASTSTGQTNPATANVKELTPSANSGGATNTSKKRKATGNNSASAPAAPPSANVPASAAARKLGSATTLAAARESNLMTFSKHKGIVNKRGELVGDDGTKLSVNDHVYLVCEPPGDPYYLCRIMEFLHVQSDDPGTPVEALRVNWYYRPRDVQRFNSDSRLVYGTMHSDICPITSVRGRCTIRHRSEIPDLEAYRKEPNSFYFVQVFDRFIRRWYECIPVAQIINVPEKVKKALDERWKFVVVEIGRVKELTSAVKMCKRCAQYCASQDSVDCAICKNSYHMNCVQPPLPKKPSRGFAWACGPCSRASERELEARNTPNVSGDVTEAEEEPHEEEVPAPSNDITRAASPESDVIIDEHPATQAEIALAKMWPMRYLGIHCRVEDALQYDDRAIYPRASSRLGPRHQAAVNMWHGHAVELVKPAEVKKRYQKGPNPKKDSKLTKEALAAIEAEREERAKRPKWVQDEPTGYVARGEDYPPDDPRCTARLIFKMPPNSEAAKHKDAEAKEFENSAEFMEDYMKRTIELARRVGVAPFGSNYVDKALELLTDNNFHVDLALERIQKLDRKKDLHEPVLNKVEVTKFEEGVAKYGSEHRLIRLHMKTNLPNSDIVRFYYLWKKTPKGREIWGNYGGRKGKHKLDTDAGSKLQAEVAHDADDSAFDNDKAIKRNRRFQCKFCQTSHARQWRKAPGVSPGQTILVETRNGSKDKKERYLLALCLRCAGLWRKYAIQWEDIDEIGKKAGATSSKGWKKRIDEELLREIVAANEAASLPPEPVPGPALDNGEPPKKRAKAEKETVVEVPKRKEKPPAPPKEPTPPPPPIIPQQPLWRDLPCAVCRLGANTVSCAHCRLTVHRGCFGLAESEGVRSDGSIKWICEQCQNDRNPQVSTEYACCLCLTEETPVELVELPRSTHKKKTDRDREKERMEKELAEAMRAERRSKQMSLHRPVLPREPLKRTTGNNWVHVYCATWSPEIRFSNAKTLEVAEGFQSIPQSRFEAVCKLCKNKDHQNRVRHNAGACVSCAQCQANFHASCAFEAGYTFGFDVTPVKGSRKELITTAKLGEETGALTAVILCKEHVPKNIVHSISEIANEAGQTALQIYVEHYKQADLTLTGTVRKANLVQLTKEKGQNVVTASHGSARRESAINGVVTAHRRAARTSSVHEIKAEGDDTILEKTVGVDSTTDRECIRCHVDVTPRWHLVAGTEPAVVKEATPPRSPTRTDTRVNGLGAARDNDSVDRQRSLTIDITGAPMSKRGLDQGHRRSESTFNDVDDGSGSYLCHKCFLRRDREPSPPSRLLVEPKVASPPRPSTQQHDWNRPPLLNNPSSFDHASMNHPRLGWDDGHRPLPPPPPQLPPPPISQMPQVNGLGPAPFGPHGPMASQAYGHPPPPPPPPPPPYPLPNGYPGSISHHGPSQHHDRPVTAAYGPPPPNPAAYPFGPMMPNHHVPPGGAFSTSPQVLANGLASPVSQHPAIVAPPFHSPYPYGAPPREMGMASSYMGDRRSLNHERAYPHPDAPHGGPHNGVIPPTVIPVHGSPHVSYAQMDREPSQLGSTVRPTTPRDGHHNPIVGPTTSAASASPSLRNLLH